MMSKKIISFHTSQCNLKCPNHKSCYHIKRDKEPDANIDTLIVKAIGDGHEVHIAVCNVDEAKEFKELSQESNVSLTMSYDVYKDSRFHKGVSAADLLGKKENIQVTCYFMEQIIKLPDDVQKLYLIKSEATYIVAKWMIQAGAVKNIHLPIDQQWVKEHRDLFAEIIEAWTSCEEDSITIDSCAENYLLHGKCMYVTDYIDINNDGSVRRCPFEPKGTPGNSMTIDDMFKIKYTPSCIYHEILGE